MTPTDWTDREVRGQEFSLEHHILKITSIWKLYTLQLSGNLCTDEWAREFCDLHVFWKSKCPKGASSNSFHMCIQPFHLRAVWAQQEVKCVGHVPLAAPLPLPPLGGGGAGLPDVNAGLLPPGGVWPLPLWVKPPGQRLPPETGSQSAP